MADRTEKSCRHHHKHRHERSHSSISRADFITNNSTRATRGIIETLLLTLFGVAALILIIICAVECTVIELLTGLLHNYHLSDVTACFVLSKTDVPHLQKTNYPEMSSILTIMFYERRERLGYYRIVAKSPVVTTYWWQLSSG